LQSIIIRQYFAFNNNSGFKIKEENNHIDANDSVKINLTSDLFNLSSDAIVIIDSKGTILDINQSALNLLCQSRDEVLGVDFKLFTIESDHDNKGFEIHLSRESNYPLTFKTLISQNESNSIPVEITINELSANEGESYYYCVYKSLATSDLEDDYTRKNEIRLNSLMSLAQMSEQTYQTVMDYGLEEGIKLTQSKVGYIYYYNENTELFTLYSWSKSVMKECEIQEKRTEYQLDKTGVWGEAVRQRKTIIVNDFPAENNLKKGYPEGHVKLFRFMTIPVFRNGKIVAVVGMGNKETDYNNQDVTQLTLFINSLWNIIDKKRAEEALKSSEEKYRNLVECMQEGVFLISNNNIIFANQALADLLGQDIDDILGTDIFQFVHPNDIEYIQRVLRLNRTIKDSASTYEWRLIHTNGEVKTVSINISLTDFLGDLVLIGTIKDITKSKENEEKLKFSEERYRSLLQNLTDFITIVDEHGIINYQSESITKTLGYEPEQMIGYSLLGYVNTDDFDVIVQEFELISKGKGTALPIVFRFRDTKGNYRWIESTMVNQLANPVINGIIITSRDISRRKQAEEFAKDYEIQLRNLLNHSSIILYVLDKKGTFLISEGKGLTKLGLKPGQVVGMSAFDLYSDFPEITDALTEAFNGHDITVQVSIGDIAFEVHNSPVFGPNGEVLNVIGVANDITEQMNALGILEESERKFRTFVENIDDMVYFQALDGTLNFLNEAHLKMIGYPDEFFQGEDAWTKLVHPDDLASARYFFDNLAGKVDNYNMEYRIKDISENYHWIQSRMVGVKDDTRKIIGYNCIDRDITSSKLHEEILRKSDERFRTLAENIPAIIYLANNDERLTKTYLSHHVETLTGYRKELFLDSKFDLKDIIYPEDLAATELEIKSALAEKRTFNVTYRLIHNNGTRRWINEIGAGIYNGDELAMVVGILNDISYNKETEEELQKISKLKSIGVLAGGIAHNFKNILASVTFSLDLAKVSPQNIQTYLDRISRSVDQATALATRFQTFSSGTEPAKEVVSIKSLILEAESLALSGSNVQFELSLSENLLNVEADPKQMNEMLMNLFINAREAMPNGGKVYVSAENINIDENNINLTEGSYIKISIKDEGIGIPKKSLQSIFDPFYTTKSGGNGLGLSTVHFIIQKHQGTITVNSDEGIGTEFDLYLPSTGKEEQIENKKGNLEMNNGNIRILFMDDDEFIRENICELGELLNFDIEAAANGEEAIELYKNNIIKGTPYDVVVLDLTVKGGMGGDETVKILNDIDPNVKAIVFSGHSTKPIVANFQDYGFKAKLDKPTDIANFASVIRSVINEG
jgi:two-component system cell cycle sensor histidine kinase/response regulator CckA